MDKTREAFVITTTRSPNWDGAEVRRRLGRAYALILNYGGQAQSGQEKDTTDRGEFGDLTRPAVSDTPSGKSGGAG